MVSRNILKSGQPRIFLEAVNSNIVIQLETALNIMYFNFSNMNKKPFVWL